MSENANSRKEPRARRPAPHQQKPLKGSRAAGARKSFRAGVGDDNK